MTEAEKVYQYFVIAVPENEEQAKAYFWARKALQHTITPLNEWVRRVRELEELYTKLQAVTGFTVEQLLERFRAGYTLEKPDYSKHFAEMENLAEAAPPNDPLTQADADKMHFDRVWIDYGVAEDGERCGEEGVVLYGRLYSIDTLDGAGLEELLLDATGHDGDTLDNPSGNYTVYRRPPKGEKNETK